MHSLVNLEFFAPRRQLHLPSLHAVNPTFFPPRRQLHLPLHVVRQPHFLLHTSSTLRVVNYYTFVSTSSPRRLIPYVLLRHFVPLLQLDKPLPLPEPLISACQRYNCLRILLPPTCRGDPAHGPFVGARVQTLRP